MTIPVGHRRRNRLVAAAPTASVRARRRAANRGGGHDARAACAGTRRPHARSRVPARQRPLCRRRRSADRRCHTEANRALTTVTAGGEEIAVARSRSGVARRAGARGIGSCDRGARARERAPRGRGAVAARGGARLAGPDRRGRRRRAAPHRTQPPRRRAAAARHTFRRARSRSFPRRRRRSRRPLARTGRGRAGDRRAPRARQRNPPDPAARRGPRGRRRGAGAANAVAGDSAEQCARSPAGPVELAAYFVVSEALTNVVKHASATEASVLLEREAARLRVTVADDGVGGARIKPESGLAGLRDRLEALDATLSIKSEAGRGTTVTPTFHARRNRRRRDRSSARESPACSPKTASRSSTQVGDADALLRSVRDLRPGRRSRRHPDASDAYGRRTSRGPRNPFALPRHRRPRPLATPRARLCAATRRSQTRARRLSDEGTGRSRSTSCSTPYNASQRASASSTGASSTTYSHDAAASIRSKSSRRASARSSR